MTPSLANFLFKYWIGCSYRGYPRNHSSNRPQSKRQNQTQILIGWGYCQSNIIDFLSDGNTFLTREEVALPTVPSLYFYRTIYIVC